MAILQMKKLKCAVVRSEKKEFLKDLTKLGCVQINQTAVQDGAQFTTESSDAMSLRTTHARLTDSVDILNSFAPEKSGLLSAKPEIERGEYLDDANLDEAISHAEDILAADERIKQIRSSESRIRADISSLEAWKPSNLPLKITGTATTNLLLGTIPASVSFHDVEVSLNEASEYAEAFLVNEDKSSKYLEIICPKADTAKVNETLHEMGFGQISFPDKSKTANDEIISLEQELKALANEKVEKEEFIKSYAKYRDELKLAADKYGVKVLVAEESEKLIGSEKVLFFEGYVPSEKEAKLENLIANYHAAYETTDPKEDEYEEVPVELKNNKFTNALNMVTNMYALPLYGTVDPNPWMAPFFIVFFGLMMADMGYGILMIIAGIVALCKMKPRANTLAFCQLLLYCGIATFICGALTGGFFSDVLYQLFNIELPCLFNAEKDSTTVLVLALVLGVLQLNAGMLCSFIQKCKHKEYASAFFEEGSLWILLIGGILLALGNFVLNNDLLFKIGLGVLIAGGIFLLFGAGREAKGIGKVTAAFGCIYNTATGWFGDVLSYSRIMALMLAGGVVGKVFNTVALMPMQNSGKNPLTIIVFIIIFLLGHAMNFGLNLLGCYVHDLRLQCLEYFGKFYTDGGKPFTPLDIKGKYINPKNN